MIRWKGADFIFASPQSIQEILSKLRVSHFSIPDRGHTQTLITTCTSRGKVSIYLAQSLDKIRHLIAAHAYFFSYGCRPQRFAFPYIVSCSSLMT